MKAVRTIVRCIDALNEGVGRAVSWLVVLMVLIVFSVVVLRYAFAVGWVWMQEIYVWLHAAVFLLGAGYTLLHDGHVRIDLIYRPARARYRALVNIVGCLALGGPLMLVVLDRSWPMILRSWQTLERSAEIGGMPGLFVLKSTIGAFCVLMGLQLVALLLRSLAALFGTEDRNDPETDADPTLP